ncbi:hypothetical protein PybrP1_010122 [[Pythium] brassicae (nom. inval.)]|nr:hypothetical protein PybrP1_010122 [[Pythium] brassicae (nom. inval.)]
MLKRLVQDATRAKSSGGDDVSDRRTPRGAVAARSRRRAASSSSEAEEKTRGRRHHESSSRDVGNTDEEAKAAPRSTRTRADGGHREEASERDARSLKPAPSNDKKRVKNTRKNTFSWDIGKAFARKQPVQEAAKAKASGSRAKTRRAEASEDATSDAARGKRQPSASRRKRAGDSTSESDSELDARQATRRQANARRGKREKRSPSPSAASASEDSKPPRLTAATRSSKSSRKAPRHAASSSTDTEREQSRPTKAAAKLRKPKSRRRPATKAAAASSSTASERDERVPSSATDARQTAKTNKKKNTEQSTKKQQSERRASTRSGRSHRRARQLQSPSKARPARLASAASGGPTASAKPRGNPLSRSRHLGRRASVPHSEPTSSADSSGSSGLDVGRLRSLTKHTPRHGDESGSDSDSSERRRPSRSDDEYAAHLKRSLRRAFDFFDLDQSDRIEKKELSHVLRALGHEFTSAELDAAMARADLDQSGQLDFHEFVAFVSRQLARKQFVLSQRREVELRQAFESLDRDQNGALDEREFEYLVFKVLGVELSVEEHDALLDFVDANGDGSINESEFIAFMRVMEHFDAQQCRSRRHHCGGRLDGPSRLAMRAMKKLNRGAPVDLDRNLLAFFGVPSNFRPAISSASTCRALAANSLAHVLSFPSPHVVVALAQQQEQQGGSDWKAGGRSASDELALLQQAESWQAQAIVSLKRAVGVPKPFDTREDDVVKRCVHVCLFQEREARQGGTTTTTSTTTATMGGGAVVGNVHEAPVHWHAGEEDVWEFSKKATKQDKYKFLVRTNAVNDHLYVLVEFIVHLRAAGRANSRQSRRKTSRETREMVCCWCKLPVRTLLAKRADVYRCQERLWGGTALAPVDIEQDEVLQRRTGWRALSTAFKAPALPGMGIKSAPVERFPDDVQRSVRTMPATIIAPFLSLPVVSEYMAAMQRMLSHSAGSSAGAFAHEVVR